MQKQNKRDRIIKPIYETQDKEQNRWGMYETIHKKYDFCSLEQVQNKCPVQKQNLHGWYDG